MRRKDGADTLADLADDQKGNTAWPSMETLARDCGLSVRATQGAVAALEAAGHITRQERRGKGMLYHVHPRTKCTPATDAPPQEMSRTPAADAPNPLGTLKPPEPSGSAPKGADCTSKRADRSKRNRGERLPADWEPDCLPDPLAGEVAARGGLWLEAQLAKFRDWQAGQAGPKAFATDWQARWRNWLREGLERAGGPEMATARPADTSELQPVGDGADGYRNALPAGLRAMCKISFDRGQILHVATSPFAAEMLEGEYREKLKAAARAVQLDPSAIVIQRPARQPAVNMARR